MISQALSIPSRRLEVASGVERLQQQAAARGSAATSRTAPSPAQRRRARGSAVASGCGQTTLSTRSSPSRVTGTTTAVQPVIPPPVG